MTAGTGATVRTVLDTGGGLVRRQVEVAAGAHHAGASGPGGELCITLLREIGRGVDVREIDRTLVARAIHLLGEQT